MWQEELEVYISQDPDFKIFLPDQLYGKWTCFEEDRNRIPALKARDIIVARNNRNGENITEDEALEANDEKLDKIRTSLRTVLSIIGKCVSEGHYTSVIKHSTSLTWIYNMLRSDYDIQNKGVHFFNILEIKYDPAKHTPVAFYNLYRTIISNNLAKRGDSIKYKNNEVLENDEKFSPMLEDLVLLDAIKEIDTRLPMYVKSFYFHKMKKEERLMDFKTDILLNIPRFVEQLESKEEDDPMLCAFKPFQNKKKYNKNKFGGSRNRFCNYCFLAKQPYGVYTSHEFVASSCPSLSNQERKTMMGMAKLSIMQKQEEQQKDEEERAEMYGYNLNESENDDDQVYFKPDGRLNNFLIDRTVAARYSHIQPIPSQILTVFLDKQNKLPFHIDLDSGATISYIREDIATKYNFTISPNNQKSKLGDGLTKVKAIGEIKVTFFRKSHALTFNAVVCKDLSSDAIGGTNFMKDNAIHQDLVNNTIHLDNKRISVMPTNHTAIMPIASLVQDQLQVVQPFNSSQLIPLKPRILLPDQDLQIKVEHQDGSLLAIEPWEQNKNPRWPKVQLQQVKNSCITICNDSENPIHLGKEVKSFKIRPTEDAEIKPLNYYHYEPALSSLTQSEILTPDLISLDNVKNEETKAVITDAHSRFITVFNKDLSHGYNGFYGKHECKLNWATTERPSADKVRVPKYNHALKGLQQELMDDLTDQGVLLIPQDHNIQVQSVCPSFIQRKQRAKNKPEHQLTKDDVRLLINFGPINEKIKPVPIHVPKPNDILTTLGKWNHLIIFDLYNGYFQNHMAQKDIPWLGVQTPFGGLRVMSRSGQGLAGMAEEFDELTAKILKDEMKEGIIVKIVDDCYIGGKTQEETASNYERILEKLNNANLKISPDKTHIFPIQADILGWVWREGGYLSASPHRKLAITNTKQENIKKVKDMRSWVGLFKTLHMVTPQISSLLAPFEEATGGRESSEKFVWTHELEKSFRHAKQKIDSLVTLYLPAPNDQLILQTDGSKKGLGHILYAVKNGKKYPARIHSTKLPDKCTKWCPCEIEGLGLALGIDQQYDIIRESLHPLLIETDSKPVNEAIKLINKGKFSASARLSSILTNVNRTPIKSKHISGKAKLNPIADIQSRLPPECKSEFCSVRKFLAHSVDSILEDGPKLNSLNIEKNASFTNRQAWKQAQSSNQACCQAKKLLQSGKPPPKSIGKYAGEYWNDVRRYYRECRIAKDGLLVVQTGADTLSGNIHRDKIVIPKPLVSALLYHSHNNIDEHPPRSQQKARFQRQFFAINLEKHLDQLYKNCYKCSILEKLPKEAIISETKTQADRPQVHFHADVIKRAHQNIFIIRDHFSAFQDAMILPSEKANDLKDGIISLTTPIRRPGEIFIAVDNAPGFKSLLNNKDEDLKKLRITMIKTDELNKNSNAVVDKACQELENELKRLEPEGAQITNSTLKLAIMNLNTKLRRRGNISAIEINQARDQNTGANLILDDDALRNDQLKKRKDHRNIKMGPEVNIGDTVKLKNSNNKHKANDIYLVTNKQEADITVQKLLHPLTRRSKLMSKTYKTRNKFLIPIHQPNDPDRSEHEDIDELDNKISDDIKDKPTRYIQWNPFDDKFFNDTDSEDEDQVVETTIPTIRKMSPIWDANEQEIEWDSSPELLQLECNIQLNDSENTEESPRRKLFSDSSCETSPEYTASKPRLKRQNAIRRRHRYERSWSETKTKHRDRNNTLKASSCPTSPSQIVTNRVQNLDNVMRPNIPIVPETVAMGSNVQNFDPVLRNPDVRRSARIRSIEENRQTPIDYRMLNKQGWQS